MAARTKTRSGSIVYKLKQRASGQEFLNEAAVEALDHWDRLSPEEQERFRELAWRARVGHPQSAAEAKELATLWKQLQPRKLIAKLLRRLATTGDSSR